MSGWLLKTLRNLQRGSANERSSSRALERDAQAATSADFEAGFTEIVRGEGCLCKVAQSANHRLGDDIRIVKDDGLDINPILAPKYLVFNVDICPVNGEGRVPTGTAFKYAAAGVRGVPALIDDIAGVGVDEQDAFCAIMVGIPVIDTDNKDIPVCKLANLERRVRISGVVLNHVVTAQVLFEPILRGSLLHVRTVAAIKVDISADTTVLKKPVPHLSFDGFIARKNIRSVDVNVNVLIRSSHIRA